MAETLVIVPTYNEIESLSSIVGRLRSAVPDADILIVDDASPDRTGELANTLAEADRHITVLHRAGKDGLGRAYLEGFAVALERDYRFIVQIDADGSHDPADIPAMLDLAHDGADVVIGSRWVAGGSVKNWPWLRQAISRMGNRYARWVLRSNIHDMTAGFRLMRSDVLRHSHLDDVASQGYGFQVEMAWRFEREGYRVAEHPITFVERVTGRSKMHTGIVIEALARVTIWGITGPRKYDA